MAEQQNDLNDIHTKELSHENKQQLNHSEVHRDASTFPLCILAHDIEIAGNVGSLFRIADAFGIEKLYLTGSTQTPPRYKIRKAARSTEKHIPYAYSKSPLDCIASLRNDDYTIVALEITSGSEDVRHYRLDKHQKCCLIIGSENKGIDDELLDQADDHIHITMYGKNSSMNVATSCAIAVHELIQHF